MIASDNESSGKSGELTGMSLQPLQGSTSQFAVSEKVVIPKAERSPVSVSETAMADSSTSMSNALEFLRNGGGSATTDRVYDPDEIEAELAEIEAYRRDDEEAKAELRKNPKKFNKVLSASMERLRSDHEARVSWLRTTRKAKTNAAEKGVKILDARRIDLANPPEKPVEVLTLQGQRVCTAGNLCVIQSQAKTGKTAVVGVCLATMIAADIRKEGIEDLDLFEFGSVSTKGKAVVFFDTEQSPFDSYHIVKRAVDRAQVDRLPENFEGYSLADVPTETRRELVQVALERARDQHGGIHILIVDGVGDLCIDLNDPAESFGLVEELVQLAINYNCPILTVLHENPSGIDSGKTRGHLGTQLTRKAESNIRLVKDGEVTTIFSEVSRAMHIPRKDGPCFKFDTRLGRHVGISAEVIRSEREAAKTEQAAKKARKAAEKKLEEGKLHCIQCFGEDVELPVSVMYERLEAQQGFTKGKSEKLLPKWKEAGFIENVKLGVYRKLDGNLN